MKIRSNVMAPVDLGGGLVRLLPGDNEVDPKAWGKVKDRRVTLAYLESEEIVVLEAPKETAAQRKAREKAEEEARKAAEEEAKKKAQGGGSNPEGT